MKRTKLFLCALLAATVLLSVCCGSLSALTNGQDVMIGAVSNVSGRSLGAGLTYMSATVSGGKAGTQTVHTLEFNPKTSDYMPLVYSQFNGYGATVINSAKNAESKFGYDVKAGVNASFFSMATTANTYGGVNISNGKIIQGSNGFGEQGILAFDSDGTAHLVQSRVTYALSVNGNAWENALEHINIAPHRLKDGTFYTNKNLYYWDTSCGTKTDVKADGVEVVFEKAANSELTVGGTLNGTVCEVRAHVSSGNAIGQNQFVLYASDESAYAEQLRALKVGDTARIRAKETIASSKQVVENCNSALVFYNYLIVKDGKNVTASDNLGETFNNARAARTGFGLKADGTLVIVGSQKTSGSNNGLTVYELADLLISMGCVTAIDLDGGGSTQMVVENTSGTLTSVLSSSRAVANSLLIVARPQTSETLKQDLTEQMNLAKAHMFASSPVLQAAIANAQEISDSATAMQGDYTKAIMLLEETMTALEDLDDALETAKAAAKEEYSQTVWKRLQETLKQAKPPETASNLEEVETTAEALHTLCDAKGDYIYNAALRKPYTATMTAPHTSFPDTDNKELTDGVFGIASTASDNAWSGFQKQATYVIDLGEKVNGLYDFHAQFLEFASWGIGLPASVTFSVSDRPDGDFVTVATVTKEQANAANAETKGHDYATDQKKTFSGRYVKCTVNGDGWMFVGEIQAFAKDSAAGSYVKGDATGDGKFNAQDCLRVRRAFFGLVTLTEAQLQAVDTNGNGKLDAQDCLKIRRAFYGLTQL